MRKQARLLRRGEERDGVTHYSYGEGPLLISRACLRILSMETEDGYGGRR
jgi:hypothetical protein